jgi:PRTRC genetic system ThiF family protein
VSDPTHRCHPNLLADSHRPLRVALVGAGGNGGKVLSGLRHLHLALIALGCRGLHVTVYDPDTVSTSNLARQAFYPADVGLPKAIVLVNRLNIACGLGWEAEPVRFTATEKRWERQADIVISCVDSRAARAEVHRFVTHEGCSTAYWLDLGNGQYGGQVLMGQPRNAVNKGRIGRLRTAAELWPEIIDTALPEDEIPSCSTLEALERQDLFVNDALAQYALNLLWRLLRHGGLDYQGGFINLETGSARPIPAPAGRPRTSTRPKRPNARRRAREATTEGATT